MHGLNLSTWTNYAALHFVFCIHTFVGMERLTKSMGQI